MVEGSGSLDRVTVNGDKVSIATINGDWHDFERKARWTIGFRVEKMRQLTFRDPSRAAHLCNGGWLFEPVMHRMWSDGTEFRWTREMAPTI
jgi:hypothetical protein